MLRQIARDIKAAQERDPAARSKLEVLLCYSGLHAIIAHRFNHKLWQWGLRLPARWLAQIARGLTGVEIHPGATIGEGLFIDHGMGTVIGETAEIGDNCTLFHGVTLGGTGKETGKRHPTLRDNVLVGAHAQVLGAIEIGEGAMIGAGAVVTKAVPPYTTVVGIPARPVRRRERAPQDFHHEQIADPNARAFECLWLRLGQQAQALGELKARLDERHGESAELDELRQTVRRLEARLQELEQAPAEAPATLAGLEQSSQPVEPLLEHLPRDQQI